MSLIRKSQPTAESVHVDRPLTNISIAMIQRSEGFVADQVFQNIPVGKQSDLYYTYPRGAFNRNQMAKRAPGTETKGIGYEVGESSYFCDVWGLHHEIPDQRRANTDEPLQPDREATELLTLQALIRRETEWVDKFFQTGVWTSETTPDVLWSTYATSDPIRDIRVARLAILEQTGFEPNTLTLGAQVWNVLQDHPEILDRVKYGQTAGSPAVVSRSTVAQVLELDRILISKAVVNSAVEGAADSHGFVAGKHALLAYTPPSPGLMTPAAGYSFSWTGYLPGTGKMGNVITRLRNPFTKSDRVEIEMAFAQKVVSPDLAHFFLSAIA